MNPAGRREDESSPWGGARAGAGREVDAGFDWDGQAFRGGEDAPVPEAAEFLLALGLRTGQPHALKASLRCLAALARSPRVDPVEGGFFRGDPGTGAAATEKPLELNARMLQAFAVAGAWTGSEELRRVAGETAAYIDRTLSSPEGALWGAGQTADEEYFGKMAHRRGVHGAPAVDATKDIGACARAISAFARAGVCLGESRLVARGRMALQEILPASARSVALGGAALDVFCGTGEARWLEAAKGFAEGVGEEMAARVGEGGGGPSTRLLESGRAAALLLRLAEAAGSPEDRASADRLLEGAAPLLPAAGAWAAPCGSALLAARHGVVAVTWDGGRVDGKQGAAARAAVGAAFALGPSVLRVEPGGPRGGLGAARFCVGERMSTKVAEPAEVKAALASVVTLHEGI